jgi:hypothetical protein
MSAIWPTRTIVSCSLPAIPFGVLAVTYYTARAYSPVQVASYYPAPTVSYFASPTVSSTRGRVHYAVRVRATAGDEEILPDVLAVAVTAALNITWFSDNSSKECDCSTISSEYRTSCNEMETTSIFSVSITPALGSPHPVELALDHYLSILNVDTSRSNMVMSGDDHRVNALCSRIRSALVILPGRHRRRRCPVYQEFHDSIAAARNLSHLACSHDVSEPHHSRGYCSLAHKRADLLARCSQLRALLTQVA